MKLTAPSKTFFLGEYGVLKNSPSIILCTEPLFALYQKLDTNLTDGPVSQFLKEMNQDLNLHFYDPWESTGGFGASSAQFALAYQHVYGASEINSDSVEKILSTYRKYFWNCEGLAPSGHDVLAQMIGHGMHFIDPSKGVFRTLSPQLEGYDFIVIKTNQKIATHKHLNELNVVNLELRDLVEQAVEGLENNNLLQVVSAIEEQNRILDEHNLICQETLDLRKDIESLPGVVVTKGCGALGADTILIVTEKEESPRIEERFKNFVIWRGQ